MQFSVKYDNWKAGFTNMVQKYELVGDGHLRRIAVAKHRIARNPPDATLLHSARWSSGHKQRELERDEAAQMKKTSFAEPAVTEWASSIVLVPKNDRSLSFCIDDCRPNAGTVRDRYPTS